MILMLLAPLAAESVNPYIWAAWAYLEARLGNAKVARKLYDAATVASPQHAAAWHGWGLLEKRQGNLIRARDLWLKVRRASRLGGAIDMTVCNRKTIAKIQRSLSSGPACVGYPSAAALSARLDAKNDAFLPAQRRTEKSVRALAVVRRAYGGRSRSRTRTCTSRRRSSRRTWA